MTTTIRPDVVNGYVAAWLDESFGGPAFDLDTYVAAHHMTRAEVRAAMIRLGYDTPAHLEILGL